MIGPSYLAQPACRGKPTSVSGHEYGGEEVHGLPEDGKGDEAMELSYV